MKTPPGTFTNSVGMKFVLIEPGSFQKKYRSPAAKPFYLQVTEVTQSQWEAVMGTNPSGFPGPDRPVEKVSWEDAQEFLTRLNAKENDGRYRLPTGAEWECACRAGGWEPDQAGNVDEVAWWGRNANKETHLVGRRKPNTWGLVDMRGNVAEWVHEQLRAGSTSLRAWRGGSWTHDATFVFSCAFFGVNAPSFRSDGVGLRCARTP